MVLGLLVALAVVFTHRPSAAQEPAPSAARVLVLGDSNIFEHLGKQLEKRLRASGFNVLRRGKPTSGLARPDFFDWLTEGVRLVDHYRPDVVIILFGGNDGQRLEPYAGERRVWWKDEATWREAYRSRVTRLAMALSGGGRRLFVLGPTNRLPRIAREKMLRVRQVQREAVEGLTRVTWIDTFALTSREDGRPEAEGRDRRGRRVRLRRPDGIHLTAEGAAVLMDKLWPALQAEGLLSCEAPGSLQRDQHLTVTSRKLRAAPERASIRRTR